jgi:hypothetical protein
MLLLIMEQTTVRKSYTFCDKTPYGPLKINGSFEGKFLLHI